MKKHSLFQWKMLIPLLIATNIVTLIFVAAYTFVRPIQFSESSSFIKPEFVKDEMVIRVHVFDNKKDLHEAIQKYNPKDLQWVAGLSVFSPDDNRCDIYVLKIRKESDLDTWGHELAHCKYGRWH